MGSSLRRAMKASNHLADSAPVDCADVSIAAAANTS
jgi:hypothetical protein